MIVISVVSEFTGESGAAKKIVMAQRQRQNDKNVSPDSCHKDFDKAFTVCAHEKAALFGVM